jgi:intein/homing endonuclease
LLARARNKIVDVSVATPEGVRTVVATAGHPFWVDDQGRWVRADSLRVDDELLDPKGNELTVTAVTTRSKFLKVHNLSVEGIHTY